MVGSNIALLAAALAFNSVVLPDPPLTPAEVVKVALQQNPKLRAARAERDAALAHNDRDKPVARPSFSVDAVGQLQGPRVLFPRSDRGDETIVPERYGRLELMVEQILYHAGAGAAKTRFNAQNRSVEWDLRKAEQETAVDAMRAYYALQSADGQLVVAHEGVEMARRQLELTLTMFTVGTASERDVKASDADLAEAELGRLRAENDIALATANLNRAIGRDISTPVTLSTPGSPPIVPSSTVEGQRIAMQNRPELRLLEEDLMAARAGISLAGSQNQPTLSARAIAAAQTPTALTDSKFFAAGLALRWSPFDQGKIRADVREARARVAQLEALQEDARLGIKLEVEKAWREMTTAQERILVATRQVSSAEAALNVSRLRYEAGSATQIEVSGSLFGVTKARSNRAQAESDLLLAHAEYLYAIGEAAPSPGRERKKP